MSSARPAKKSLPTYKFTHKKSNWQKIVRTNGTNIRYLYNVRAPFTFDDIGMIDKMIVEDTLPGEEWGGFRRVDPIISLKTMGIMSSDNQALLPDNIEKFCEKIVNGNKNYNSWTVMLAKKDIVDTEKELNTYINSLTEIYLDSRHSKRTNLHDNIHKKITDHIEGIRSNFEKMEKYLNNNSIFYIEISKILSELKSFTDSASKSHQHLGASLLKLHKHFKGYSPTEHRDSLATELEKVIQRQDEKLSPLEIDSHVEEAQKSIIEIQGYYNRLGMDDAFKIEIQIPTLDSRDDVLTLRNSLVEKYSLDTGNTVASYPTEEKVRGIHWLLNIHPLDIHSDGISTGFKRVHELFAEMISSITCDKPCPSADQLRGLDFKNYDQINYNKKESYPKDQNDQEPTAPSNGKYRFSNGKSAYAYSDTRYSYAGSLFGRPKQTMGKLASIPTKEIKISAEKKEANSVSVITKNLTNMRPSPADSKNWRDRDTSIPINNSPSTKYPQNNSTSVFAKSFKNTSPSLSDSQDWRNRDASKTMENASADKYRVKKN